MAKTDTTKRAAKKKVVKKKGTNRVVQFFRDARAEIRRVIWPTPKETRNMTVLVLALSGAVGGLMFIFDWVFSKMYQLLAGIF